MEEDNLILKNWLQQKKILVENLIISRKRPTKDSVHDLRVAVKKLRSYLRLNESFTKEDWRGSFSEIKTLFKSFGRLRDFDMSLELARRSERKWQISLIAFKQYLTINRSLTRRWAKQAANSFNEQQSLFNFQFSFFSGMPVTNTSEKIIYLSIAKIKKIKRLQKHFHKNAHEIRKQLKDVLYWLKICPKEFAENFVDIKHLDSSLKFLGSWQDDFIFKRKIKQYVKSLASKNEKEILAELEKRISHIQNDLLEKARNKLAEIKPWKTAVSDQSSFNVTKITLT
jgi:CHAD domain-containing protein